MTRALVTGICGQDGSYLAERLVGEGVEVHGLVLERDSHDGLPAEVVRHVGDLTDAGTVTRLVIDLAPDEVYNLAAVSSVADSWDHPRLCAEVNGLAAVMLADTAQRLQERTGRTVRLVQASSAEIFGHPDRSPQDETTPVRPVNPYGAAKAYAHHAMAVHRARGLHAVSAILYNHESPRRPPGFVTRRVVQGVAAVVAGRADVLVVGNLDSVRDWGWAPDHVDAMVRAARADRPDDYVVATGEPHTVRDLVATAFAAAGVADWEPLVTVESSGRPTDLRRLVGDATRARTALGWAPTVGFEEMVQRMVRSEIEGCEAPPTK